jgi:hypothetical protein
VYYQLLYILLLNLIDTNEAILKRHPQSVVLYSGMLKTVL